MNCETKQLTKKERAKRQPVDVGNIARVYDTANHCSCLDNVKDYSRVKGLVVTFVDIKEEELPEPLYDTSGFEWQIWRKDYGEPVKYYWHNHILDKKVTVLNNDTPEPLSGFIRLYRGFHKEYLPKSLPVKKKAFLTKAPTTNKSPNNELNQT